MVCRPTMEYASDVGVTAALVAVEALPENQEKRRLREAKALDRAMLDAERLFALYAAARDAVLAAVKSINFRADKGQAFDAKVVEKVKAALGVDKIDSWAVIFEPANLAKTIAALKLNYVVITSSGWRESMPHKLF